MARTMQLECPEVWERMMARDGARLLMLGTPNGGSWAPMQVLSGDDTFGNALVAFGGLFDDSGTGVTICSGGLRISTVETCASAGGTPLIARRPTV